jgi:hypothetical protein
MASWPSSFFICDFPLFLSVHKKTTDEIIGQGLQTKTPIEGAAVAVQAIVSVMSFVLLGDFSCPLYEAIVKNSSILFDNICQKLQERFRRFAQ